ncbi:DUF2523 domain-containing protein [Variovorax sp. W6]|uniref:DUF2523 domain-containing protein n=1 Tax=Variovorax sp. W6 TaxID=3093895 RepID=UPI003D806CEE
MPWLIAALWTAFRAMLPSLTGQVLLALGIGIATTVGINVGIGAFKSQMLSAIQGLPAVSIQVLGLMKVGVCISMLFGALVSRMARKGMQAAAGGSLKSWVKK